MSTLTISMCFHVQFFQVQPLVCLAYKARCHDQHLDIDVHPSTWLQIFILILYLNVSLAIEHRTNRLVCCIHTLLHMQHLLYLSVPFGLMVSMQKQIQELRVWCWELSQHHWMATKPLSDNIRVLKPLLKGIFDLGLCVLLVSLDCVSSCFFLNSDLHNDLATPLQPCSCHTHTKTLFLFPWALFIVLLSCKLVLDGVFIFIIYCLPCPQLIFLHIMLQCSCLCSRHVSPCSSSQFFLYMFCSVQCPHAQFSFLLVLFY